MRCHNFLLCRCSWASTLQKSCICFVMSSSYGTLFCCRDKNMRQRHLTHTLFYIYVTSPRLIWSFQNQVHIFCYQYNNLIHYTLCSFVKILADNNHMQYFLYFSNFSLLFRSNKLSLSRKINMKSNLKHYAYVA